MMRMSAHFHRVEFKCNCDNCNCDTIDAELILVLEDLRAHFNSPVVINSAHRCREHNKEVGGSENSYHLSGRAADIVVVGVQVEDVQDFLEQRYPDKYGIGRYSNFTHIDTRTGKGRWNG